MDVNYFIKKFRSIPEALWTTATLYNGWTHQRCALGFCNNEETAPFQRLFLSHLNRPVQSVNDSATFYPQTTPKARILAALEYIKTS